MTFCAMDMAATDIMTRPPAYSDRALARDLAAERSEQSYKAEIERRIELLMEPGAEFDPFSKDNLSETLGDIEICDELHEAIGTMLRQGEFKAAGIHLQRASIKYWEKLARAQAMIDLDAKKDAE